MVAGHVGKRKRQLFTWESIPLDILGILSTFISNGTVYNNYDIAQLRLVCKAWSQFPYTWVQLDLISDKILASLPVSQIYSTTFNSYNSPDEELVEFVHRLQYLKQVSLNHRYASFQFLLPLKDSLVTIHIDVPPSTHLEMFSQFSALRHVIISAVNIKAPHFLRYIPETITSLRKSQFFSQELQYLKRFTELEQLELSEGLDEDIVCCESFLHCKNLMVLELCEIIQVDLSGIHHLENLSVLTIAGTALDSLIPPLPKSIETINLSCITCVSEIFDDDEDDESDYWEDEESYFDERQRSTFLDMECIGNLENLRQLHMIETPGLKSFFILPRSLKQITFRYVPLPGFEEELEHLENLTHFKAASEGLDIACLTSCSKLISLHLRELKYATIKVNMECFSNLETLSLRDFNNCSGLRGLDKLLKLNSLSFYDCSFSSASNALPPLPPNLTILNLSLLDDLMSIDSNEGLDLTSIGKLHFLKQLDLSNSNLIKTLPILPASLEFLTIEHSIAHILTNQLSLLKNLKYYSLFAQCSADEHVLPPVKEGWYLS